MLFSGCDTETEPVKCNKHEIMCNNVCVFIDDYIFDHCIPQKNK